LSTYLIDFENVGSDGLDGVSELTEKDNVIIFYSINSNKISIEIHQAICSSHAKFEYFRISSGGKNALDFQLATYLGYLISANNNDNYYIISKDMGYQHILKFWKNKIEGLDMNASVICKCSISHDPEPDVIANNRDNIQNENMTTDCIGKTLTSMSEISDKQAFKNYLARKFGKEQGNQIYNDINIEKISDKQDFYRRIVAIFGQEQGSVIYKKLKHLLK